jgi:uncharacterized integral membrane protein (TIGR00697 family)
MIKKFDLLVALYVFGVMVTELMGAKTFPVATIGHTHLHASVAIFVVPLLFTITDVIVEVKGKERARSVVLSGLIMVGLLVLFSFLATHLQPTQLFKPKESAYDTIFGASIRLSLASLAAFAVSELLDVAVFAKLRKKLGKNGLWFRNNVSNFVSQFFDSAVFLTLAFYSLGLSLGANYSFIIGLIIPYWLFKCFMSVLETPLVYVGVWWLRGNKTGKLAVAKE